MSLDRRCRACGAEFYKVLYAGFPMLLCSKCDCVEGFWSFVLGYLPFNGEFFWYDEGYLRALWVWVSGKEQT